MIDQAQRNPVTTILAVGAIAAFAADLAGRGIGHLVLLPQVFMVQPWTLLTTVFPHGNAIHLLFNLYWIWPFGCAIESRLGSPRYAALVAAFAGVSMGAELLLGNVAIGLSGVVYGLVTYAYYRGRRDPHFRGLVPEQLRNFFVVWFFVCIALTALDVMRIANVAHGFGALAGWAFGQKRRWVPALLVVAMAGAIVGRPHLRPYDPLEAAFQDGVQLMIDGEYREAADFYQAFVLEHPNVAEGWWNLSIARQRLGDVRRAKEARDRALALNPDLNSN